MDHGGSARNNLRQSLAIIIKVAVAAAACLSQLPVNAVAPNFSRPECSVKPNNTYTDTPQINANESKDSNN